MLVAVVVTGGGVVGGGVVVLVIMVVGVLIPDSMDESAKMKDMASCGASSIEEMYGSAWRVARPGTVDVLDELEELDELDELDELEEVVDVVDWVDWVEVVGCSVSSGGGKSGGSIGGNGSKPSMPQDHPNGKMMIGKGMPWESVVVVVIVDWRLENCDMRVGKKVALSVIPSVVTKMITSEFEDVGMTGGGIRVIVAPSVVKVEITVTGGSGMVSDPMTVKED